jgi:uroporphyrinogen-III decarboxylase
MAKYPDNWGQMTPEQKRAYRLENFRKSGENIQFISPKAKKNYEMNIKRLIDVYDLREPDRVPFSIAVGNLPLTMAGLNMHTAFYEPQRAAEACMKFNEKYSEELETFAMSTGNGEALEILDYKLYVWPGHGLPKEAPGWQFIEGEYMTDDEYDDLIGDPSDFWLRKYLPRVFGAFEGFRMFQPFTNITENVHIGALMPLATPAVRDMLNKLLKAGEAFQQNNIVMSQYMGHRAAWGFPSPRSSFCKAPFDTLGDTLRGTTNIMKDMYRRPDKLLKALDVIADISIDNILKSPNISNVVMVGYPLHKGADGWMSQKQFDTFYWPSLKKVMDAFIKEGLIQSLFAEGGYNTRLDYINQFPRAFVLWHFDRTDMVEAKRILGKDCALRGNVPSSLIATGKPDELKEHCRKLIEVAGKDGGYILSPGCYTENPKLENLKAVAEVVREYGFYKK